MQKDIKQHLASDIKKRRQILHKSINENLEYIHEKEQHIQQLLDKNNIRKSDKIARNVK